MWPKIKQLHRDARLIAVTARAEKQGGKSGDFVNARGKTGTGTGGPPGDNACMETKPTSWARLARVLRGLLPLRAVDARTAFADEVSLRLGAGGSLGAGLSASFPALSSLVVGQAVRRFEGGASALLIVEVLEGLKSAVGGAADELERRGAGAGVVQALRALRGRIAGDTFVQHLINTSLEALGLYTESMTLERRDVDEARLVRAVTELLSRSLPAALSATRPVQRPAHRGRGPGAPLPA